MGFFSEDFRVFFGHLFFSLLVLVLVGIFGILQDSIVWNIRHCRIFRSLCLFVVFFFFFFFNVGRCRRIKWRLSMLPFLRTAYLARGSRMPGSTRVPRCWQYRNFCKCERISYCWRYRRVSCWRRDRIIEENQRWDRQFRPSGVSLPATFVSLLNIPFCAIILCCDLRSQDDHSNARVLCNTSRARDLRLATLRFGTSRCNREFHSNGTVKIKIEIKEKLLEL